MAAALLVAARAVGDERWEREALAAARTALSRPRNRSGVIDAGLCHGSAGLAHLFARLHHATGDPDFADEARYWYAKTLAFRRPGAGIAGWAARRDFDSASVLSGAAGVGLTLLAATNPVPPAWDRLLLASPVSVGA